jgi:hypothetical protein
MELSAPVRNFISDTDHLKHPETAEEYAQKNSEITVLGVGNDRLVILDPYKDIAVKISYNPKSPANTKEHHIYSSAPQCLKNDLLPILSKGTDCHYLVVPYIPDINTGLKRFDGPRAKKIYDHIKQHGFDIYEIETTRYNGSVIAIDYGT